MNASSDPTILQVAEAFHPQGSIRGISPLGSGNVNDTYLVESDGGLSVLQRINTAVFERPQLVMHNLQRLGDHMAAKLHTNPAWLQGRRWQHPQLLHPRLGEDSWHRCSNGGFWRSLSFVAGAHSVDVISDGRQAIELGRGLGLFHRLISDLPVEQLEDTLEGFHIAPRYLAAYRHALVHSQRDSSEAGRYCVAFIREREGLVPLLEDAKRRGVLHLRPIHGDPKINNVMLDSHTGEAVALVDLDTVKPGLVHTDIGDCLRSCCNRQGEETRDWPSVQFDLELAEAILRGYLEASGGLLSAAEIALLPDATRLISLELGLRFFTDHLNGNVYFKARHPDHNLERALVQFQLTASIEAQMDDLRQLVAQLAGQSHTLNALP